MATSQLDPALLDAPPASESGLQRVIRWIREHALAVYAALALIYMFLPVAIVVVFSFNNPAGRQNTQWNEFSLDAWFNICSDPTICEAVGVSATIALVATAVGTILGTMISFALVRHRFHGRSTTNLLIFLPMATPEVVLGSSLLALFLNMYWGEWQMPLGFWTILIAHIMFVISFVVVTVKARLSGLDPRLEQAAMDLYADEKSTFRYVTLPLVAPGIMGAALLAFSLSFDDFIITNFNSGSTVTFPMYIWGAAQRGIPPQVNVIASIMFFGALAIVLVGQVISASRRRAKV
ncbi:MAG TPA: ABC transporter permease [Motilibacterales bacterium]|nr:ABC transporter permease [Motilibacterales bacterium]